MTTPTTKDGKTAIVNRGPSATGSPVASPNDLVFGRYQIIRRLAVGGMGEVFLARQSGVAGFDRLIILKSLLPDLADQKDFVDQFLDEARVAATLNHPNIVSIYEVGQWNGTYFIAMEYIKGDNLSRLQRAAERAKRAIPLDVAAFIIHDAAHALDHAHKATDIHGKPQNIVHRDISPQNIMVRTDGVTKVVDFGIAKAANRSSRTATGLLKGKVQYMSPEQVSGVELDGRSDQFALGVTIWEMVAGRKLFTGGNDIDILRAVINSPIPPLQSARHDVPAQLAVVVDRMLSRDRERRYPTLAEAAADLKKYLDVTGVKNAQQHTAQFVADMLGDEISAKTVDLTPSGANNFVINLAAPSTSPTSMNAGGGIPRRAKVGIAAGVSVALVLAGLTAAIVFLPETPAAGAGANLLTPPPPGAAPKLAVETEPTGAVVKIDDKEVGKTPLTVDVTPDVEHTVVVEAPGYEPRVEKLKLATGQMKPFVFVLAHKKAKIAVRALLDGAPVAGVEVKSSGKVIGKTPFEIEMDASEQLALVAALKRGKDTFAGGATAKGAAGETTAIDVKLAKVNAAVACPKGTKRGPSGACQDVPTPTVAAPVSGKGLLTLDTKPWAKLYIDGKYVDSTPLSKYELTAGPHTLRMVNEAAGVDEQRKITIKPGETFKATWQLKAAN